jgi:hypothetical protein
LYIAEKNFYKSKKANRKNEVAPKKSEV